MATRLLCETWLDAPHLQQREALRYFALVVIDIGVDLGFLLS